MPNLLDRIERRIEKLAIPFVILLVVLAVLGVNDVHLIYGGFCFIHGTLLLSVPILLLLALWSFFMFFVSLTRIRRDAIENAEIYEQASKNTAGIGMSPRGGIVFGLEVARLKEERSKKIKELYPEDKQNPDSR